MTTDLKPWWSRLKRALKDDPGRSTVEELQERVSSGEYLALAVGDRAVIVLQRVVAEDGGDLHIVALAGGRMHTWLTMLHEVVKELARDQGAARITASGRPGWHRALRGLGYRTQRVTVSCEV